jgi:hypothetical protein
MNSRQRYGPHLHARQVLWVQVLKFGRQRKQTNQDVATMLAAGIWVQSGKIMGFVAAAAAASSSSAAAATAAIIAPAAAGARAARASSVGLNDGLGGTLGLSGLSKSSGGRTAHQLSFLQPRALLTPRSPEKTDGALSSSPGSPAVRRYSFHEKRRPRPLTVLSLSLAFSSRATARTARSE